MDLIDLLRNEEIDIIDRAADAIARAGVRPYAESGRAQTREQLKALFDLTVESLVMKSTTPIIKYAEKVAEQRFSSGFSLREVQTAINVLEESIWSHILSEMKPKEYAAAVGLVSTVLRLAKESVAGVYFAHISKLEVPPLDRTADFFGTEDRTSR